MQKKKMYERMYGNKRYSYEELKKEIEAAILAEKSEWEKKMGERLNSERTEAESFAVMSADERSREELDKKQRAFEEERELYMSERMEFEAAKALANKGLPISFAGLLKGADAESTAENVEMFKNEFLKAVEEEVSNRLKGFTPQTGINPATDPFLNGLYK